jgi:hypothetical protein
MTVKIQPGSVGAITVTLLSLLDMVQSPLQTSLSPNPPVCHAHLRPGRGLCTSPCLGALLSSRIHPELLLISPEFQCPQHPEEVSQLPSLKHSRSPQTHRMEMLRLYIVSVALPAPKHPGLIYPASPEWASHITLSFLDLTHLLEEPHLQLF